MSELLTLDEMKQHYPNEWLLIDCTELDENLNIIRGKILAHSSHKEDLYQPLSSAHATTTAIEYAGDIPEDLALML
jgi:hypothetical protein